MGPGLTVDVHRSPGTTRVRVRGELDIATVPIVREALDDARAPRVVLDLSELSYIDSSGVRLAFELDAAARRNGHSVAFVPGPPQVHRVFEIVGLADHFTFEDA